MYVGEEFNSDDYVLHLKNNEGPHCFCSFDEESFHFLDYKSLEWVMVRPRFYSLEGGILVQKQVWYDSEKEFVKLMEKYNIPYELENGVYTIYGYK